MANKQRLNEEAGRIPREAAIAIAFSARTTLRMSNAARKRKMYLRNLTIPLAAGHD